ncbi:MAG TPA: DUF6178 family protein [Myxococcota bacterium]|nr:DUF6178 family protein [Myxococcota bacterium]HRY96420.1 DUF6178 family protein [Myxococcota bacterium]
MTETHAPQAKALEILKQPGEQAALALDSLTPGEQRALLLGLPPGRQRQDLALLSRKPAALVRLLAPEDFYATVMEIGPEDALPMLELSSNAQLGYLMDLQLWVGGNMDVQRLERWLELLHACSPERTTRFLEKTDFELLVLWLERSLLFVEREALDALPAELQGRVISPDNYHHFAVKLGADLELVRKSVQLLFAESQELFLALSGNLGTTPLAELEEQLARWRQGRLADRGWPDAEEALAFYLPRAPGALAAQPMPLPDGLDEAPAQPLQRLQAGPRLQAGLEAIGEPVLRARLATQLANLANRVIVADGQPLEELASLQSALARVAGRLEIGLGELGATTTAEVVALLAGTPLLHLAQVAEGALRARQTRARALLGGDGGWLLGMLCPPRPERLAALLQRRPRFLPGPAEPPREFTGPADLQSLDRDLEHAEAALVLARALGVVSAGLPEPFPPGSLPARRADLELESLLFTLVARDLLALDPAPAPLPVGRLPALFAALPREQAALAARLRGWASARLGAAPPAGLGGLLDSLARRAAEELLGHDPRALDPRYAAGIWLQVEPVRG